MSGFETNHAEEQSMELEALEAIYAEAFKVNNRDPLEWQVHLEPTEGALGEVSHVGVNLICRIPEKYPDEPPGVDVEVTKGLTPKQAEELLLLAQSQARDNVGMAMGYTIAECLKEWLVDNNLPSAADGSMHGEMLRRMAEGDRDRRREKEQMAKAAQAQEEEEDDEAIRRRRQADGTPVTPESFSAWKVKFDADIQGQSVAESDATVKKPSGKEMFLRHLVAADDEDADADEAEEDLDMVVGDEGAFLLDDDDDQDDDLDDLSDDEAG